MITPSFGLTATERVLPSMALDFTTASLDSRVTFTRSGGTATRVDATGAIVLMAADTPRFDYDPDTLECKGLLIEEARTNLLLNSILDGAIAGTPGTAPTSWSLLGSTGEITSVAAGDYANGNEVVFSCVNQRDYFSQTISVSASTTYIGSVTINKISGTLNLSGALNFTSIPSGSVVTYFLDGVEGISTDNIPDGVHKLEIHLAVDVTSGTAAFRFGVGVGGNRTAVAGFQNPQMEAGAFATSYIPTTTAQVTRTADVVTMTSTNFSDWFNPTEGTFSVTVTVPVVTGVNMRFISANDNTTSNRIDMYGITNTQLRTVYAGSGQTSITSGSISNYQERTSVGAYKEDLFATATNADSVSTNTSGTVPTVNQLFIGRSLASNSSYCNGTIKQINYWQQRLTDNEVVAFSKGL